MEQAKLQAASEGRHRHDKQKPASKEESHDQSSDLEAIEDKTSRCLRKLRLKLSLWNALVLEDAQLLWSTPESEEVWSHYGYDVRSLQEAWYAHVIEWVQINLACGVRTKVIMKQYRRFVARTQRLSARCKEEKRHDDLKATLANISNLFEPGSTTTTQEIRRILREEREAETALFCLLRNRPDLLES